MNNIFKLLLFLMLSMQILNGSTVDLTKEEKNWITNNKVKIGMINDYYPFSYKNDSKISGFSYEYFNLIASKVNLKFEIEMNQWSQTLTKFKNKDIDIIDAISYTEKREEFTNFTNPYFNIPNVIFGRTDSIKNFKGLESLKGKKVGITKDIYYFDTIKNLNLFNLIIFESSKEKFKALALGKLDAAFNNLTSGQKYIVQGGYANIKALDILDNKIVKKEDLRFGVLKEKKLLYSIIQKSMNSISQEDRLNLVNKYFGVGFSAKNNSSDTEKEKIKFSKEEKDYISKQKTIKVHCVSDTPPYTYLEDGKPKGYSIDHIKLVASKIGLDIDIVTGYTWNEYIEQLKNEKIDVMLNIVQTKERKKYFNFTSKYFTVMSTVFVQKDFHPKHLNDLNGKTISIVKGFSEVEPLKTLYPKIKLLYVENETEAFKMVSLGKVDATINNIGVGSDIINEHGLLNLKSAFEIKDKEFLVNLHLATNQNNKILKDILEKGLESITKKEKINLRNKWLYTQDLDLKKANMNLISLSEDEKLFIKSHPIIRVHNETNWPPFNYNEDGKPLGYSIDVMNLISKKAGFEVEYITGPTWNEFLTMMKAGSLDVMLNIVKTPERQEYLEYTPSYSNNPNSILSKKNILYKNLESLFGKTVAVPKGFFTQEILEKKYPQIKLLLVKDVLEAMKAISFGKADAALGELAVFNYLLNEHMMTNLEISGEAIMGNPDYSLLNIATRKELPILASILTKGINSITNEEKKLLQKKWLWESKSNKLKLSIEEQSYLNKRNSIRMCVDPNFLPYEKIDKNGKYIGIGADIINLVSKSIDKPITLISTSTWTQSIENIKNKNCDILPVATNTTKRQKYMNFTKPYIKESLVIATKIDQLFIKDSSELSNKKIGVVNGYSSSEFLKKKNPKINIVSVKSAKDGLEKVQNGELFGYIDALPVIAYVIQKNGFLDLKIAGSLEFQQKLSLASREDEPLLNSILQKSLNNIGDQKIRAIIGKWISIKVEQSFDYSKLFYISLVFFIILALVIHRNRTISILNNALDEKNKQLAELSIRDNLTKLYNRNKLDEVLIDESNRANRFNYIFGVIIIDIDFFKNVNDNYGHQMGDTTLKEFANILKSNSRKTDIVGRWGGEEFLIICSETNLEGIISFANILKEKISNYSFSLGEKKTASFGVSIYKKDEDIKNLIKRADDALYTAKEDGRNKVKYKVL